MLSVCAFSAISSFGSTVSAISSTPGFATSEVTSNIVTVCLRRLGTRNRSDILRITEEMMNFALLFGFARKGGLGMDFR